MGNHEHRQTGSEPPRRPRWGWLAAGLGAGAAAGAAAAWNAARAREARRRRARIAARHPQGSRTVVLGAGFGGLACAAELARRLPPGPRSEVVLVDRHNYQLFTPLLYHAATGLVDPSHLLFPVRSLSHWERFRFHVGIARGVDFSARRVLLERTALEYDQLVVALGSTTNYFGRAEWAEHTLPLKTSGDAVAIRNRIIAGYERADQLPPGPERRACLTFVVVGGGATGVELMGALSGLVRDALPRQYPRIPPGEVRVLLIEASDQLLPGLPPFMGRRAHKSFLRRGVDVRLRTKAVDVTEAGVRLRSEDAEEEFVPAETVVWVAGVRPGAVVASLDAPKARDGRLLTDSCLAVVDRPGVYALGDCAACPGEDGEFLAPNAAVAVQQGRALAEIIGARLAGETPAPFRYRYQGELISLGRYDALAEVGGARLTGLPAWLLWRAFYLSGLMGAKNRLGVALDWSFAYFYQRDTVQLACHVEEEPEPFPAEEAQSPTPERVSAED